MKKLLFISLILVIIGGTLLTACSGSTPATSAPVSTTTTNAPASTTSAQPTKTTTATQPVASTTTSAKPSSTTPQSNVKTGGTLKYLSAYSPSSACGWPLDNDWVSMYLINFVYAEPLVLLNADGTLEPMLATKWEFSPDYKSVTFTLRQGVKFHDGTDFNADAVKFMFDSNIEAKKAAAANWKSIEVLDNYHIRLNLNQFNNSIWEDLRGAACFIVSPTNVKNNGLDYARQHPVGTGPFMFVSFERDVKAVFKKNPNYWLPGKPYLEGLEFIYVKDITTQEAMMQAGGGHVMTALGGRDLYDMKNLGFDTYTYAAGTEVLEPDSANATSILAKKNVRLALDYAINRDEFCKAIGYGFMYPNNEFIPTPHPQFNKDIPMREYNPDKAKQILSEAGYPTGFNTTLFSQPMFEQQTLLVQQYFKAINVTAEIKMMDNAAFWESSAKGWQNGMWYTGVSVGPNFASGIRSVFQPYGLLHKSVAMPAAVTETIDKAIYTHDEAEQLALNHQIAQLIYDDTTLICINSSAMGYAISPKVHDAQWLKGADWQYWNPATTWIDQ